MTTIEIKNWLKANNNTFLSAQMFFEMMNSCSEVRISLTRMFSATFEMALASTDGVLATKVLVVKNVRGD
jgi:hypothetical protein